MANKNKEKRSQEKLRGLGIKIGETKQVVSMKEISHERRLINIKLTCRASLL